MHLNEIRYQFVIFIILLRNLCVSPHPVSWMRSDNKVCFDHMPLFQLTKSGLIDKSGKWETK